MLLSLPKICSGYKCKGNICPPTRSVCQVVCAFHAIRPPAPRSPGQAVVAQRRRVALLVLSPYRNQFSCTPARGSTGRPSRNRSSAWRSARLSGSDSILPFVAAGAESARWSHRGRLVCQRAVEPGFTHAGGATDDRFEVTAQPLVAAQLQDQGLARPLGLQ